MPALRASSSASASARSPVSAAAPIAASTRRSARSRSVRSSEWLSGAAMRAGAAPLPPPLALRGRAQRLACRRGRTRRRGDELRLGLLLLGRHRRRLLQHAADRLDAADQALPPRVLALALLQHGEQRGGDEDRRVRTGAD